MNIVLWIIQALLAALFLFAGITKLVTPLDQMAAASPIQLSGWFIRFLGVAETLGGLGLILPGLFKIRPMLTPLAALGLLIIMIGAVWLTLAHLKASDAVVPLVAGLLLAFVAYERWKLNRPDTERRSA